MRSFVHSCLCKEPEKRLSAKQLLQHEFLKGCPPQNVVAEIFFKPENETISVQSLEQNSSKRDNFQEETFAEAEMKPEVRKPSQLAQKKKGALSLASEAILSLAHPNTNKGSIVGTLGSQLQPNQATNPMVIAEASRASREDQSAENEQLSDTALKIKRAAAKIDKLRPGLANLVDCRLMEDLQRHHGDVQPQHGPSERRLSS